MKRLLTLMLVLTMVLITACGSNNSGGNTGGGGNDSGTGGQNTGSASGEVINIGFLAGLTGWIAPYAKENFESVLLAKDEINEAGGILGGRQINIIDIDTGTTVEGAIKGFQKLVNVDKAVAAIGPETESFLALLNEAPKNGIVIMSQYAGAAELDKAGGNYAFRTAVSDSAIGEVRAKYLIEHGYDELVVLVQNNEGPQSEVRNFVEFYEQFGGKVIAEVTFNAGQNSYNAELQKIADLNPRLVYYAGGIESAPMIFKPKHQRGYDFEWLLSGDVVNQEFIDAIGADVGEGIRAFMPTEDSENENFQRFNKLFEEKYGRPPSPGYFNANAYDLVIVSALAMEAAGEASGKAINDYIREVTNPDGVIVNNFADGVKELRAGNSINYEGASGPVDFDEFGNIQSTNALYEIQGGKWVQIEFFDADYVNR